CFFVSGRRRHTRSKRDWSSDVCSSDLVYSGADPAHQDLSVALALSQHILEGSGGAWRMQGGGFAGTIQAFVPAACLGRYRAAMEDRKSVVEGRRGGQGGGGATVRREK